MRSYFHIDKYLDELQKSVYPQPADDGHTAWAAESINVLIPRTTGVETVLDVGCGEGFCQPLFEGLGIFYCGIALGEDVVNARAKGRSVWEKDFTFTNMGNDVVDLVYSRHSLEHSPFPLLTLMEWKRLTTKYIAIVVPAPEHWTYRGKNHYFVLNSAQWENLFETLDLNVLYKETRREKMGKLDTDPVVDVEFWYLLEKKVEDDGNI